MQRDVQMYHLGEFTTDTSLFSLPSGGMVRIELYIWLEGQDVDCTNAMNGAQLIANIQFTGETRNQSGLKPITPEYYDE